jgi:type IV secretory pathway VirD2 relaxase
MDEDDFEPKLGRMRTSASPRGRKYLHRVIAAVALSGGVRHLGRRRFSGERIGRGAPAGRLLASRGRVAGLHGRRAMVKARLVRLGGKASSGARAHLRYIQRDGATRDGEPGRLYSAAEDAADGKAFLERSEGDRHQFRFIVSAEDGAAYEDLRPLIRRVMAKMEEDLGTRLDWVAADHLDTLHPHTHIMLRGKDDRGENLVIARDYISRGMRERVAEQVSLDLGPRTGLEIEQQLRREVGAERMTSIDSGMLRDMDERRSVAASGRTMLDHALRAGRLRKLESLGLAVPDGRGRWLLDEGLERKLRAIGERGDIVRTMQRALTARGVDRAASERVVHDAGPPEGRTIVGRLVARGLSDEAQDRHYLIVDGVDGRAHYIDIGLGEAVEPLPEGSVVKVSAREAEIRPVDRIVAEIAARNGGRYSEALHLESAPADPEFVRAHVRRLEAIRRSVGGPERLGDGSWTIGADHLDRAAAFEARARQRSPVRVELLSSLPLETLPASEGATWLDRELVGGGATELRQSGFGAEVRAARALRQAWLVEQGLASQGEGRVRYRRDLLTLLRQRELLAVGSRLAEEFGLPVCEGEIGERVGGRVARRLDLASGRFALLQGAGELVLVPWRPELERQLGREISGKIGAAGLSWSRGRTRGIEIG